MARIILRLECFHDDIDARRRAVRTMPHADRARIQYKNAGRDLRLATMGGTNTWVAEITGMSRNGRMQRKFVDGLKDYGNANSVGSRGVFKYYVLVEGPLYEIVDRPGYGKPQRRRYCRVHGKRIVAMPIAEALQCLP